MGSLHMETMFRLLKIYFDSLPNSLIVNYFAHAWKKKSEVSLLQKKREFLLITQVGSLNLVVLIWWSFSPSLLDRLMVLVNLSLNPVA